MIPRILILLLLWPSLLLAGQGMYPVPMVYQGGSPATTYYLGYLNEIETVDTPSGTPNSSTILNSGNRSYLRKITIPAGSTVQTIHYYCGAETDYGTNQAKVVLYEYVSDTQGGSLLASADLTPSANSWVESGALSGSQTYFSSDTTVFMGIALSSASMYFTVTRNSSGSDYFYKDNSYMSVTLGSGVSSASYGLATVLEYQR